MSERQKRNGFDEPFQSVFQDFMAAWLFSEEASPSEVMDAYFTPDFVAEIDGHILERKEFQSRISRMRQDAEIYEQEFIEMMETGNKVFSMHITRGISRASQQPFETRAIALFEFAGMKLRHGYLNSVTLGDSRDADFASRS